MKTNPLPKAVLLLASAAWLAGASALPAHPPKHPPAGAPDPQPPADKQAKVQIALLLDTSNSMDGLIGQAKTQLWKVVNTFIAARKDGRVPFVEIALYEYGNTRLSPDVHWIRQVRPLTRDLDQLSADLFSLATSGGDEYCGAVIARATADLQWDPSPDTYKAIFIAGNEPFTQGPVNAMNSCRQAVRKGILVNTIHCGPHADGLAGGWKNGSAIADGTYLVINQDKAVVHIEAPQDKLIIQLNTRLNATYIPYGKSGQARKKEQAAQDGNAEANKKSGAAVQRAVTKSSGNYWNGNWDLCDAAREKGFDWAKVKKEDLPENLRGLTSEELKKHVADNRAQRAQIQKEIQDLNKARAAFVAQKQKEDTGKDSTLDQAMQTALRAQASKKGYAFEE